MEYQIKSVTVDNQINRDGTDTSTNFYKGNVTQPRIYVHHDDETLEEHFTNRRFRPTAIYRKAALEAMRNAGFDMEGSDMHWSATAGCTMCPCSPGFVVETKFIRSGRRVRWDRIPAKYTDKNMACRLTAYYGQTPVAPLNEYRGFEMHITIESPKTDAAKAEEIAEFKAINGLVGS